MPSWAKIRNWGLCACLALIPLLSVADDFAARIRHANLTNQGTKFGVHAQIRYRLSPTAKEALHKGIALNWIVVVEIREIGKLWDSVAYRQELPYGLQFHALLNQYEVITPDKQSEMFLTLNVALSYMSSLRDAAPIPAKFFKKNHRYKLAMKCLFDRESLPVPLRPFAYLDSDWYLSSDWYLWPIQK